LSSSCSFAVQPLPSVLVPEYIWFR